MRQGRVGWAGRRAAQVAIGTLLALASVPFFTDAAEALDRRRMMALHVHADEALSRDFGRLDAVMRRLKAAGRDCTVDSYTYGGSINCGPRLKWDVLIGFIFAPTRAPDFIIVDSIRAHGIDGGEMPKEAFNAFLETYLKPAPKTAR